jgi:nitrite reductase/ring-hydroxylating ferredoxin subunit
LFVRRAEHVHALDDRCSHRGCLLHDGKLQGDTIVCPCHGSTFALDGSVLKGPATSPQPSFEVRSQQGTIEIRQRDA